MSSAIGLVWSMRASLPNRSEVLGGRDPPLWGCRNLPPGNGLKHGHYCGRVRGNQAPKTVTCGSHGRHLRGLFGRADRYGNATCLEFTGEKTEAGNPESRSTLGVSDLLENKDVAI